MTDFLKLFVDSMLINNIVLMGFLGICSFLGVSTKTKMLLECQQQLW